MAKPLDAQPPLPGAVAEEAILGIAQRQHGLITRSQLLGAGLTPQAVVRRLHAKRLRAVHRGVYLVGPLMPPQAKLQAALFACGDDAIISHRSAAGLEEILPPVRGSFPVEVSVRGSYRRRPGIRIYRVVSLPDEEIKRIDGLPLTIPARTLLDLAGVVAMRDLERAVARAFARDLTTAAEVAKLLVKHARRPGAARLRAVLGSSPAHTRSKAEERFLTIVEKGQIARPEVNVNVFGYEVDFYWRRERLVVEVDGFAYHGSTNRFETDRRRDADLSAAGIRVMRITWRQLVHEPEAILVRLTRALATPGTF